MFLETNFTSMYSELSEEVCRLRSLQGIYFSSQIAPILLKSVSNIVQTMKDQDRGVLGEKEVLGIFMNSIAENLS